MAAHLTEQEAPIASTSVDGLVTQFLGKVFTRKQESRRPKRSQPPWESWKLDKEFFGALSQWSLTHPETTLDRVLKNISDGLEKHQDVLDLVPGGLFPARGLVIALGHLIKLGVMISSAKAEVYDFAKHVIRWVGAVKAAFESQGDGRFTRLAWRDLRHMRDLINEVCTWAVDRINDRRWAMIANGLKIQEEIQEFNQRITDAQVLFQDLSAINLAKGIDAILSHIRKLVEGQRIIIYEIRKIRHTQDKQFTAIMDELTTQRMAAERERFLEKVFAGHVIADPTYDKQGKHPCDPETRVEVLAKIDEWINDVSPGSPNFLWLTGDPGSGKSAVTASVSRECKKRHILWAQFFINRNNAETTDPNSYFPSIARQLAQCSAEVAEALQDALYRDPSLTDSISAAQAAKLFVDSVRCASRLDSKKPVVVVIDGLDETDRKRLEDTAKIFSTLFTALEACSNVKVFISSRTEDEIRNSFILPLHDTHVKRLHLDTADPLSIRDVSQYIKQNLSDLVRKHNLNWAVWPGDERPQKLGERASGLFIWAVTAIKFIQERLESDGKECFSDVLDMLTADVLHDINSLYTLILKVTYGPNPSEWNFERFRRIVGAIVFLQEPLCIDDLATLLDLRKTPSSDPVDITHFVRRFRTILVTGTDFIDGSTVPRIHKSVFEFITNKGVDAQLTCVVFSPDGRQVVTSSVDQTIRAREAANSQWIRTLVKYSSPIRAIAFSPDGKSIVSGSDDGILCLWDSTTGAPIGQPFSEHKDSVRCVAFSPDRQQIVSGSVDNTCILWNIKNGQKIGRPWTGHQGGVISIAFSASGRRVCSSDYEGNCIVWDASTGEGIRSWKQTGGPNSICFSPQNDDVVAVSGPDGIEIRSYDQRWTIPNSKFAECLSFSSNGKQIIFATEYAVIIAEIDWDQHTTRVIRKGKHDGSWELKSLAPDLRYFAYMLEDVVHVRAVQHSHDSIDIVPVTQSQTEITTNNANDELKDIISNLQEVRNNTTFSNRLLDSTKWYESKSKTTTSDAGATLNLLMVTDETAFAADFDGSVSVWNLHTS